jgi:hypothetical protein
LEDYKKGRTKWAKKNRIVIDEFRKYSFYKNKKGLSFHLTGIDYSTPELKEIKERSLFINCKDDYLFHIKFLLLKEHFKDEKKLIKYFTKSVSSCK